MASRGVVGIFLLSALPLLCLELRRGIPSLGKCCLPASVSPVLGSFHLSYGGRAFLAMAPPRGSDYNSQSPPRPPVFRRHLRFAGKVRSGSGQGLLGNEKRGDRNQLLYSKGVMRDGRK